MAQKKKVELTRLQGGIAIASFSSGVTIAAVCLFFIPPLGDIVSIEIVTYKYDLLDIWVSLVKQPLDAFCPVSSGSLPLCYSLTPSGQGFSEKEDAAGAIPHIFVVLVSYTCTVGSKAISCFCQKLNRFLVHTYDRVFGIIWTAVHLKDVLHRCDESRVMAGWYAPALLQMRPVLVFLECGRPAYEI